MMTDKTAATPYDRLDPDTVLQAVESTGLVTDGRMLALNSYENRVYQVGIDERDPIIAKFYRPGRWTDEQIREEHEFTLELSSAEIPVVPPLESNGQTLNEFEEFRFALFTRHGGHAPELDNDETLLWLGRFLGRIHVIGKTGSFRHRPALTPERFGQQSLRTIIDENWLPPHLETAFSTLGEDLMKMIDNAFLCAGDTRSIRLHGDCHPGNILWRNGPWFVDMDDCQTGPAIQDLWMLMSGEASEMTRQLSVIMEGYQQFCEFERRELHLIEALRTLRMLHHSAWLARRWNDPAFPRAFPWFGEANYWETLVLSLREQLSALQEPPLELWD